MPASIKLLISEVLQGFVCTTSTLRKLYFRGNATGSSLLNRVLIPAFLVLIVVSCEPETQDVTSPIKALSTQSAVIVETGNFHAARQAWMQNVWMQTFAEDRVWSSFTEQLDPLLGIGDSLDDFLANRRLFFSLELTGKGSFGILASTNINADEWAYIVNKHQGKKSAYSGKDILAFQRGENIIYAACNKDVLLCSPHNVLIEDGLRRLDSEHALDKNRVFNNMRKTTNRKDHFNVYVQYSEIATFIGGLLNKPKTDYFPDISRWTALDVNLTGNGILMSGLSDMGDSLPSYLDAFAEQKTPKIQSAHIVPSAAAMWVNFSTNNYLTHLRHREAFRKTKGSSRRFQDQLSRLDVDLEAAFARWVDHFYGLIYLESSNHPRHKRVAYFSIRDENGFTEAFSPLVDEEKTTYFRGEKILALNQHNWLRSVSGRAFDAMETRFAWVFNNYVFFSASVDVLTDFMTDVLDERTLGQSLPYRNFTSKIPDKAAVQVTFSPKQARGLISDYTPKSWAEIIKRNETLLEHTPYVSLQYQPQGKMAFTGLYIAYQESVEQIVKPVWSADIPARVSAGPFLLKNHYNKQQEIVVQDENNVLYLFGTTGKLLWKKALDGRILGNIEQVDLFRNGKLQMAFTTPSQVVILDRNGNHVEPFPVKTKDTITSPLAVFDYDNTRNYRFVYATGNRIHNLDKTGKPVKGWELDKVEGQIKRTPEHHVAGSKDYLVFLTETNKAYLTDRRGRVRVKTVLDLPKNHHGPYQVQSNVAEKTVQLTNITLDGELMTVLSSGKKDIIDIGKLPDRAKVQIWNDQMLIYGENSIKWQDQNKPLTISLEQSMAGAPKIFGSKKPRFFATASNENQIYVFDENGQLVSGFPVYGTANMTLSALFPNGNSAYTITVTPENKLVVYLIE